MTPLEALLWALTAGAGVLLFSIGASIGVLILGSAIQQVRKPRQTRSIMRGGEGL